MAAQEDPMADLGKVALATEDFLIVETTGEVRGKKRKVKINACYLYKEEDGSVSMARDAVIEELH